MDAAGDLPQVVERADQPVGDPGQLRPQLGQLGGHAASAARRSSTSDTSRCWMPSCRSRSMRRRAWSAAATIRARDAASSARFCLQRARHRVEAALEHADLADAALRQTRAEVTAGEPAGHRRHAADRLHDRPRQVAGEQDDEERSIPLARLPPRRSRGGPLRRGTLLAAAATPCSVADEACRTRRGSRRCAACLPRSPLAVRAAGGSRRAVSTRGTE